MADEKPITPGDAGSVKLPTIAIPTTTRRDKGGWPLFTIQAPAGEIVVRCYWHRANCRGTIDALVSAGFMRPEWAPGFPGNNVARQTVAFEASGPRLMLGGRGGIQTKEPRIVIKRVSRRTLAIEIPLTPEQEERIKALLDERNKEKGARAAPAAALTPEGAQGFYCSLAEGAIEWIRKNMAGRGCTYTRESMNQIQQAFEGLRRAFADGRVVPLAPKYQRVGNVACWPGRGRVAPVAPESLQ